MQADASALAYKQATGLANAKLVAAAEELKAKADAMQAKAEGCKATAEASFAKLLQLLMGVAAIFQLGVLFVAAPATAAAVLLAVVCSAVQLPDALGWVFVEAQRVPAIAQLNSQVSTTRVRESCMRICMRVCTRVYAHECLHTSVCIGEYHAPQD